MPTRPYVLISCAMSVDRQIDDTGPAPLMLSGPEDLDRVDELRASADAILVGANTVRRDNPRLIIRSPRLRAARVAAGRPQHPRRVAVTTTGDLDRAARFFAPPKQADALTQPGAGAAALVYCASPADGGRSSAAGGAGRDHRRR